MIPIPYQQVDEFLRWLSERHPAGESQGSEGGNVKEVLLEYLKTKGRVESLTPAYALRIFQTCPMMYEPTVREQMTHFAGCGSCLHYIHERYKQYPRWLELHPLLERFLQFCEQSKWRKVFVAGARSFDSTWMREGPEYIDHLFREYIRRIGPDLLSAFEEYLEVADPALVLDYEAHRAKWTELPQRPPKPTKEWIEPLAISEGLEQAAERLIGSVYLLLEGRFYKEVREDPQVYRPLVSMGLLSKNAARGIEFLSWLQERYPELDLFGSVPTEGLVELVLEFCEQKGYADTKNFSQEVMKWIRGDAEQVLFRRLSASAAKSKEGTGRRVAVPPFARYQTVTHYAMFLFHSSGDFPAFIRNYWKELNYLTANTLNVYYSFEDLQRRSSDPEVLSHLRSIQLHSTSLPALLLWRESLSGCRALPLDDLSHQEMLDLIRLVVDKVIEKADLADIFLEAKAYIEHRLSAPLPVPEAIVEEGGIRIKAKDTSTSEEDAYALSGQVLQDRSTYVVETLKAVGPSEIAEALEGAQKAVMANKDLSDDQKQECLEIINQIGEEFAKRKPNITLLRILREGLKSTLQGAPGVADAVDAMTKTMRGDDSLPPETANETQVPINGGETKGKRQGRKAFLYVGLPLLVVVASILWNIWEAQTLRTRTEELQSAQEAVDAQKHSIDSMRIN
ncbi:MAG: hypothetical protein AABZ61_11915, partial [Bacteroidota bacterium]